MNNCHLTSPEYFYREYSNDIPKDVEESNQVIRLMQSALPFVGLYDPFGKFLAGSLGTLRFATSFRDCLNSENHQELSSSAFNSVIAIASIAGTVFLHPVGMMITTLHDMGICCYHLYDAARSKDHIETAKQLLHLSNHGLYFVMMLYGSLEWQVASLAMQVIVEGASSAHEFAKGRWLEGTSHMLMTGIRGKQLHAKVEELQFKWEIEEAIKSFYVGELHEKWQFPSDHLPVGVEVDGHKVVSWNVLNNKFIDWVTKKDSQGLNRSMISDLDVAVNQEGLTKRDLRVIEMIQSMIKTKAGVIALQECGFPFVNELEAKLPPDWKMVRSFKGPKKDQEILLYNQKQYTYRGDLSEVTENGFPCQKGRIIQNGLFQPIQKGKKPLRIFNSHVPGDPALPGVEQLAQYVRSKYSPNEITVSLGDMNFERERMIAGYKKAGFRDFKIHSPWQTNIDPYSKKSKAIDHIFIIGASSSRNLRVDEVMDSKYNLAKTLDLLKGAKAEEKRAMNLLRAEQIEDRERRQRYVKSIWEHLFPRKELRA